LKRIGTAEKNENKDGKLCIVTMFETMWNGREFFWKQGR